MSPREAPERHTICLMRRKPGESQGLALSWCLPWAGTELDIYNAHQLIEPRIGKRQAENQTSRRCGRIDHVLARGPGSLAGQVGDPQGRLLGGGLDALGQGLGPSGKPPLCSG